MTQVFDGLRILDFSWSVAGPTVTRILGSFGAEVMKVEWPGHPDPMRTAMFAEDTEPTIDNGSFFAGLNIGKESLTLNAGTPEGMKVVEKLLKESDVIVESFSAKMLRRWGLDYDRISAINPGIIYLSISGFGHSGPYESYDTWGPTAQAFSGLTVTSGLPGREPAGWGYSYMDVCAGYLATVALLAALHKRHETGIGQYIDVAQAEAGISLTGAAMLDAQVNGRQYVRPGFPPGNTASWPGVGTAPGYRGETGAPYGIYPTADEEQREAYCAITVMTDAQWRSLRDVMGNPMWARDTVFDGAAGRLRHQVHIDKHLAEWTSTQKKHELMHELQAAGVPAGAVQNAEEIMDRDPQLESRKVFQVLEHPLIGTRRFEGVPINYSKTPVEYKSVWPVLSGANKKILSGVAGLSEEEIKRLDEAHITWPAGLQRNMPVKRPLW